jgi:hypothetical protein
MNIDTRIHMYKQAKYPVPLFRRMRKSPTSPEGRGIFQMFRQAGEYPNQPTVHGGGGIRHIGS